MGAAKQSRRTESALGAVVGHPLRTRCLTVLAERTASPTELKDVLRVPLSDVAYHVKRLHELEVIELVETRPVRGALEHFYRAVRRPTLSDGDAAAISLEERLDLAVYACQLAFADISRAINEGTFCRRSDQHVSRIPLLVDEAGWDELRDIYADALERILDVQATSAERISRDPDHASIPASALAMFFEVPERAAAVKHSPVS